MTQIEFSIKGAVSYHDAAIVLANEDPREVLVEAAVQSLSTDMMITVGDVTMHLAAWMDPYHWSEDWEAIGVEDVDALLAGVAA